ncbi:MAG: hypothetical protein PHN84_13735 [Desulfuromonadaceae bacterium]|nr:hypothetical protein [Desulfuromonadaceae bacterium]MDD2857014.1 hypothetical protein [Desulfuromonadaceae bacterium]
MNNTAMNEQNPTGGRPAGLTAAAAFERGTTIPQQRQKRTLKSLISNRGIRGYLLERQEFLENHPDRELHVLVECLATILDAAEPRSVII